MSQFRALLLVGAGGFLGSILRYLVGGWAHALVPTARFPVGTLLVNVLGCLAIGWIGGLLEARDALASGTRLFLVVGILGGFTTYSSYAYETLALLRHADLLRALANLALQTVLGLGAAWLGYALVRA